MYLLGLQCLEEQQASVDWGEERAELVPGKGFLLYAYEKHVAPVGSTLQIASHCDSLVEGGVIARLSKGTCNFWSCCNGPKCHERKVSLRALKVAVFLCSE
jgi:hypothetical protein